ncbi:substrate-binding periplasmic protein [Leeia oryzae]|uniref:substrate-binding periplasmic protein n=1 Tax=Leeia oryzae TaxID=356662 RepID=UPI0003A6AC40|nr:transporter substrate-binding domain-containing protein [Leeia oryzae]
MSTCFADRLNIRLTLEEYPPYMGENLPYKGILSRLVAEVFAHEDVKVTFVPVTNNRGIVGPMAGIYDGAYGWAYTPERAEKLLYTEPIYTFRMVFFQRRDRNIHWKTLPQLSPYLIGVTKGNFVSDEFSALQQKRQLRVDEGHDDISGLRKLLARRIDLFPMEYEAGYFLMSGSLSAAEQRQLTANEKAIWEVPVHVQIYRGHPRAAELVQRFNRGLASLGQIGYLNRMLAETKEAIYQSRRVPAGLAP